jgi:hypothetical protein
MQGEGEEAQQCQPGGVEPRGVDSDGPAVDEDGEEEERRRDESEHAPPPGGCGDDVYHGPWNLIVRPGPWECGRHGTVSGDSCDTCVAEAAAHRETCGALSVECPAWRRMLVDPSLGTCSRMREGCSQLGRWRAFYQDYVCTECARADQDDVLAGRWPFQKAATQ